MIDNLGQLICDIFWHRRNECVANVKAIEVISMQNRHVSAQVSSVDFKKVDAKKCA